MNEGNLYDIEILPAGEKLSMSDHFVELHKNGCKTLFLTKNIESVFAVAAVRNKAAHVVIRFTHGDEVKLVPDDANALYARILLRLREALL